MSSEHHALRIGPWHIDTAHRTLIKGDVQVKLTPRSWDVLTLLIASAGKLVSTENMLATLWSEHTADESYVRKSISEIRRAFGDDGHQLIRTVPKKGYVFSKRRTDETARTNSVAVLPFANFSSDADKEHFGDGLIEEILNRLTRERRTAVVARTSSFEFKDRNMDIRIIGQQLNVSHILEGSVRRAGKSVKVTAQLIDAVAGVHLLSETYQRNLGDVFAVQEDVAEQICRDIRLCLHGDVDASDPVPIVYVSSRFDSPEEFSEMLAALQKSQ